MQHLRAALTSSGDLLTVERLLEQVCAAVAVPTGSGRSPRAPAVTCPQWWQTR
jgi:hypothetical protein